LAAGVDGLLIAGDLFDHGRVDERVLAWTAAQLDRLRRPVVLLPGNHDLNALGRFDAERRCRAVRVISDLDGEVVDIEGTAISVWGRAMREHEPAFQPLAGVPARPTDRWCVVAGHGLVVGAEETYRSSPIRPDDLAAVGWDYIALGHVHEYRNIAGAPVPACYAGATAGGFDRGPGGVLVDFVPGRPASPQWVAF
jgi:exonuclease SbcD